MSNQPDRLENLRLISLQELLTIVPYTATHIYRLEAQGSFPRRLRVGPNRVAWRRAEIIEWLENLEVADLPVLDESQDETGAVTQIDMFRRH